VAWSGKLLAGCPFQKNICSKSEFVRFQSLQNVEWGKIKGAHPLMPWLNHPVVNNFRKLFLTTLFEPVYFNYWNE